MIFLESAGKKMTVKRELYPGERGRKDSQFAEGVDAVVRAPAEARMILGRVVLPQLEEESVPGREVGTWGNSLEIGWWWS